MDFLTVLVSNADRLGTGAVALFLLAYFARNAISDRKSYETSLSAAEQRHSEELQRVNEAHAQEMKAMRDRLDSMEGRLTELTRELDEERRKRWRAEDAAAEARRPELTKGT